MKQNNKNKSISHDTITFTRCESPLYKHILYNKLCFIRHKIPNPASIKLFSYIFISKVYTPMVDLVQFLGTWYIILYSVLYFLFSIPENEYIYILTIYRSLGIRTVCTVYIFLWLKYMVVYIILDR